MALVVASVLAQEAAGPAKNAVTDATVINLCGGRLAKMFAQCGTPVDISVKRGDTPAEDDVLCNYGAYAFRVRDKLVRVLLYMGGLEGHDQGSQDRRQPRRRGESARARPRLPTRTRTARVTAYGYDLKDLDADFFVNFDKDGKVWRVEISLK